MEARKKFRSNDVAHTGAQLGPIELRKMLGSETVHELRRPCSDRAFCVVASTLGGVPCFGHLTSTRKVSRQNVPRPLTSQTHGQNSFFLCLSVLFNPGSRQCGGRAGPSPFHHLRSRRVEGSVDHEAKNGQASSMSEVLACCTLASVGFTTRGSHRTRQPGF